MGIVVLIDFFLSFSLLIDSFSHVVGRLSWDSSAFYCSILCHIDFRIIKFTHRVVHASYTISVVFHC